MQHHYLADHAEWQANCVGCTLGPIRSAFVRITYLGTRKLKETFLSTALVIFKANLTVALFHENQFTWKYVVDVTEL